MYLIYDPPFVGYVVAGSEVTPDESRCGLARGTLSLRRWGPTLLIVNLIGILSSSFILAILDPFAILTSDTPMSFDR